MAVTIVLLIILFLVIYIMYKKYSDDNKVYIVFCCENGIGGVVKTNIVSLHDTIEEANEKAALLKDEYEEKGFFLIVEEWDLVD